MSKRRKNGEGAVIHRSDGRWEGRLFIGYDGQFIKRYSSLAEAAEAVNAEITNLSAAAWGKQKTCKGFVWKFTEKT